MWQEHDEANEHTAQHSHHYACGNLFGCGDVKGIGIGIFREDIKDGAFDNRASASCLRTEPPKQRNFLKINS